MLWTMFGISAFLLLIYLYVTMNIIKGPFWPKFISPPNHPPHNPSPSKDPSGRFASLVPVSWRLSLDPEGKKVSSLGTRSFAIRMKFLDWEFLRLQFVDLCTVDVQLFVIVSALAYIFMESQISRLWKIKNSSQLFNNSS